jgi:hypothetical protein
MTSATPPPLDARPSHQVKAPKTDNSGPIIGVAVIMLTFYVIGLAWILYADNIPWADADFYFRGAKSLAEGDGYLHPFRGEDRPTAFHPVGYPWFVAQVWNLAGVDTSGCDVTTWPDLDGCDTMIQAGQFANLLLATVNIGLVFVLAWLIKGPRTALLSAGIYAIIPSRIFFTSALMSEEAFVAAVLSGIIALVYGVRHPDRVWISAVGFGFAIAAATFIRPLGIVLLPLPLILLFSKSVDRSIPLTQFGLAAAIAVVALLPWTIRNHNEVGGWNLVSNNGGINLWIGCHLNDDGSLASNGKWMDWWSGNAPSEINTPDERGNDREAQRLALQCMREEPLAFARLSLLKGLYTFREDWEYVSKWALNHDLPERSTESIVSEGVEEAFGYFSNSVYITLLPLAVVGALAFFFGPSVFRGVIGAAFAALALIPLAFFGEPRFHVPLFPIISIWAAEGVFIVLHGLRSVGRQAREGPVAADAAATRLGWKEEPWLR